LALVEIICKETDYLRNSPLDTNVLLKFGARDDMIAFDWAFTSLRDDSRLSCPTRDRLKVKCPFACVCLMRTAVLAVLTHVKTFGRRLMGKGSGVDLVGGV
jgi:hypothetical protein